MHRWLSRIEMTTLLLQLEHPQAEVELLSLINWPYELLQIVGGGVFPASQKINWTFKPMAYNERGDH
jgi:hypothetical protein